VDQLGDLFGDAVELNGDFEATTLGGLVSEIEGRIPLAGEVVVIEPGGIKTEIVASTTRKVERVRVFPPVTNPAESD
jgi:CBS domain containing-hemolysin-like protein